MSVSWSAFSQTRMARLGIPAGLLLVAVVAAVSLTGLTRVLSYAVPVSGTDEIQMRPDGSAYQDGQAIGGFRPYGGQQRMQLAFPSQVIRSGPVRVTLSLPAPLTAPASFIRDSIQGPAGLSAYQLDGSTLLITMENSSPDAHPVVTVTVPADTFSVSPPVRLASALYDTDFSVWAALSALILLACLAFYAYQRDAAAFRTRKQVAATPPVGIRPLEFAVFIEGSIRPAHVSALIIDLALRGHLEIIRNHRGVFFIRKESLSPLLNYEEMVLQLVAPRHATPSSFQEVLGSMDESIFSAVISGIYLEVYTALSERGYLNGSLSYVHLKYKTAAILLELGALLDVAYASLVPASVLAGPALLGLSLYGAGALLYSTGYHVLPLTPPGSAILKKAQGFRRYLAQPAGIGEERGIRESRMFEYLPFSIGIGVAEAWLNSSTGRLPRLPTWFTAEGLSVAEPVGFTRELLSITGIISAAFVRVKDPNVD